MSEATDVMVATAKSAASDQVVKVIGAAKASFLSLFGSFVSSRDLADLEALFTKAALAKADQFAAGTPEKAQEFSEEYDTYMDTIETIGDRYLIVGKAKAGVFVRSMAHQIISGAFAIAGAVLQAGLAILIPGIGSLIGAGVNVGIQHVVSHFLGDKA